jgi:hypothetical protein
VFSKETPDLLYGIGRCLAPAGRAAGDARLGARGRAARRRRPPDRPVRRRLRRAAGRLALPRAARSAVEGRRRAAAGLPGRSFEPGRSFATEVDFQEQLDRWFGERANLRFHRTLRCRPADWLAEELAVMRSLPEPDVDRRFVTRVPPDPYVRIDSNDDSLDPRLVGRRVELRLATRDPCRLAGHGRARLPAPALVRAPPDDHRARARSHARGAAWRPARARGRAAAAGPLRRPDPGMSTQAELAHLVRTLKAPAAARALPKLAERARQEAWSYERLAEALLQTEVASRDGHGGESRIKRARFPARKTLDESTSVSNAPCRKRSCSTSASSTPHRPRQRRPARPARSWFTPLLSTHSCANGPASCSETSIRSPFRHPLMTWVACRSPRWT